MNERKLSEIQAWQDQMDAQVMRAARPASGPLAEIERAKGLLDKGIISQAEFDTIKANAIASMGQGGAAPVYPQYVGSITWFCSLESRVLFLHYYIVV